MTNQSPSPFMGEGKGEGQSIPSLRLREGGVSYESIPIRPTRGCFLIFPKFGAVKGGFTRTSKGGRMGNIYG